PALPDLLVVAAAGRRPDRGRHLEVRAPAGRPGHPHRGLRPLAADRRGAGPAAGDLPRRGVRLAPPRRRPPSPRPLTAAHARPPPPGRQPLTAAAGGPRAPRPGGCRAGSSGGVSVPSPMDRPTVAIDRGPAATPGRHPDPGAVDVVRSEERRVGRGWRGRRSTVG